MAKTSQINRNKKREKLVAQYAAKRAELKKIREAGVSVDDEENTPGIRCVAAPIFTGGAGGAGSAEAGGMPIAAVSLTGPAQLTRGERLSFVIDRVKWAARQISQSLSGRGLAARHPV